LIRTLPLGWIYNDESGRNSIANMFKFFRINFDNLRDVELLDIFFNAFWEE